MLYVSELLNATLFCLCFLFHKYLSFFHEGKIEINVLMFILYVKIWKKVKVCVYLERVEIYNN